MFSFQCSTCSEVHEGVPGFAWKYPLQYLSVPEAERARRCVLTRDTCVIDGRDFFVRGCLEIPVIAADADKPLIWGVWTTLSASNFAQFRELLEVDKRSGHGPYFGWLAASIPTYPDTLMLKTMVHLRDGMRPYIELEPTQHPLGIEQKNGITVDRVQEIYDEIVHRVMRRRR